MADPPYTTWTLACPACGRSFTVRHGSRMAAYACACCRTLLPAEDGSSDPSWPVVYLYGKVTPEPAGSRTRAHRPTPPLPERIGPYKILDILGRGGMGTVYLGWDETLRRRVAIKMLHPEVSSDAQIADRFLQEARAGAALSHPGIVPVLDVGREGSRLFFAMALIEGPSLGEVLDAFGDRTDPGRPIPTHPARRLPFSEGIRICAEVADALHHAHLMGVVHRDVKPANILLDIQGRAYLTDFSVARFRDASIHRLTASGQVLGTPLYMSPEQALGRSDGVGPTSDVYSLGAVLFRLLTGRDAFEAESPYSAMIRRTAEEPPIPRSLAPDVPPALERICMQAMSLNPAGRYPTALDMAEDLRRCLEARPVLARRIPLRSRWHALPRTPRRVLAASVTVVLVVGTISALVWGTSTWSAFRAGRVQDARDEAAALRYQQVHSIIEEAWADGRTQEARTVLDGFLEEHAGTVAVATAWGEWADRQPAASDERIDALAHSFGNARSREQAVEALVALGRCFAERWDERALSAVLDTLRVRVPEAMGRRDVELLQARSAIGRGDLTRAVDHLRAARSGSEATTDAEAALPVLEALSTGIALDLRSRDVDLADLTGAGADFLVASSGGDLRVLDPSRGFREVKRYALPVQEGDPVGLRVLRMPGGDALLVASHREVSSTGTLRVLLWPDEHPQSAASWEDFILSSVATGDVDGDGAVEAWVGIAGYGRHLLRLDPAAHGVVWSVRPASPEIRTASSHPRSLLVADLDQDGRSELLLGTAEWNAYDLRWFDADSHGRLNLRWRRKLGEVAALALLEPSPAHQGRPTLVVAKGNRFPSQEVFPLETPYGKDAGLYFFRASGQVLEQVGFVPLAIPPHWETPEFDCWWVNVADLDGDGLQDVVVDLWAGKEPGAWVLRGQADGSFRGAVLEGIKPLATLQADGDAAAELVVSIPARGDAIWILGLEGQVLSPPIPEEDALAAASPPHDLTRRHPALARHWESAEVLASVGLWERAGETLRSAALLAAGTSAEGPASERAAQMLEGAGQDAAAAALHEKAAELGISGALAAAVRTREHQHAFADVLRLSALAEDRPGAEAGSDRVRQWTEDWVHRAEDLVLDLREPLSEDWRFEDPLSARKRGGGLRVHSFADGPEIARLPVTWSGDALSLTVDLDVQRAEWGSSLAVALVPRGAPLRFDDLQVSMRVGGGGGHLVRDLGCGVPGGNVGGIGIQRVPRAVTPGHYTLQAEATPIYGHTRCTAGGDVSLVGHGPLERNAPPIPAALDLVIGPAVGLEEPHLLTADITRITVRGLGVRIDRGGEGGGVSLVEGRPEQALLEADRLIRAGLLSDEEEARLRFFAAVAMADLGRGVEARATSRRLLASQANDELRKRLVRAVRIGSPLEDGWIAETLGPVGFARATGLDGRLRAQPVHDDAEGAMRALERAIGSLPTRGAVSPRERDLLEVQLRGIRGEVYRRMGNLPAARQDLERVAALAHLHPGEGDEADAPGSAAWYREQAGRAERVLALVEADDGDAGVCLAHARRAVALSAAPEVTADVLLLHPRIAAWRARAEWSALLDGLVGAAPFPSRTPSSRP